MVNYKNILDASSLSFSDILSTFTFTITMAIDESFICWHSSYNRQSRCCKTGCGFIAKTFGIRPRPYQQKYSYKKIMKLCGDVSDSFWGQNSMHIWIRVYVRSDLNRTGLSMIEDYIPICGEILLVQSIINCIWEHRHYIWITVWHN